MQLLKLNKKASASGHYNIKNFNMAGIIEVLMCSADMEQPTQSSLNYTIAGYAETNILPQLLLVRSLYK